MNIAFVVNNYPPKRGGVEQHVHALGTHLAHQGHNVTVVTLGDGPDLSVEDGIKVYRFKEYLRVEGILGFLSPLSVRGVVNVLKREKVDVISVHTRFFSMSWLGVALGRLLRVPVVHTEHGSDFVVSEKTLIRTASRLVDLTLGALTLKGASKVVGVSQPSCDFVRRLSGVEAEVFYNVSPLPAISPEKLTFRRKRLVFLARVVEVKGWRDFLETVQILHAEDSQYRGLVLGAGPDLEKAKSYACQLGIEDAVDFRGFVNLETVSAELQGATLVNPTVAAEGFQTTIIDAFVSQAAIVTYDVSSARVLEDAGVRINIVTDRGASHLAQAIREELAKEPRTYPITELKRWGWGSQAAVYAKILSELKQS